MVRRAARVDENQTDIVNALRSVGVSVQDLSAVGRGCPDLLCGFQGRNILMEVKRPDGPRGGRTGRHLTADQVSWHGDWAGSVFVVRSVDDAINVALGKAGKGRA